MASLRIARLALSAGLSLALLPACPESTPPEDTSTSASEYFYDCTNAPAGVDVYATDESYKEIVNRESAGAVTRNDAEAATLMTPAPGSTLSAATPPAFNLRAPMAALAPTRPGACPPPARAPWWRWLSPIGTAHAHCPGVSGDNFLVRLIAARDGRPVYTALVSVTSFTPGTQRWQAAMAGRKGETLNLTLLRAGLEGGRVTIGPFVAGQTASFTVGD